MQILDIDQNSDEWRMIRMGKITGSKLDGVTPKVRGTGRKIGFYELLAERLAVEEEAEDPMERGSRLESEAVELFANQYGKMVDRVGFCISDANPNIALSPDGLIATDGKYTEAVEVKCLSAARHLEAYFEKKIPSDYDAQVLQYFIVNQDLETLHFVFFDPRIKSIPMFHLDVKREEVKEDIQKYLDIQIKVLEDVDSMLESLLF